MKAAIFGIVLTGIVTFLVNVGFSLWQQPSLKLVYSVVEAAPFEAETEVFKIQHIKIWNAGDKPINNVSTIINAENSEIKKTSLKADIAIDSDQKVLKNIYRLTVKELLPADSVTISLLLQGDSKKNTGLKVSLRGDGIIGEVENPGAPKSSGAWIGAVISAYIGLLFAALYSKRYRQLLLNIIRDPVAILSGSIMGSFEPQNKVLGSLFAIRGLSNEAEVYLNKKERCSYWSESDLLTAQAINSNDHAKVVAYIDIFKRVLGITSSKCVLNYNLAKLYLFLNKQAEAEEYLKAATKIDKDEVKERCALDPAFISFIGKIDSY